MRQLLGPLLISSEVGTQGLHNDFRTQQACFPRAKARARSVICQRRSNAFISTISTSETQTPSPAEEERSTEELVSPLPDVLQEESDHSSSPANKLKVRRVGSIPKDHVSIALERPISHDLRGIMRTLSSPVVVLTTTAYPVLRKPTSDPTTSYIQTFEFKTRPKAARGMTLSSFASLTLSPEPIITFNIRRPSSTLKAFSHCQKFLIHILDATPEGARIADVFTKGNGKEEISAPGQVFVQGMQSRAFDLKTELVTIGTGDGGRHVPLPRLSGRGVGKVLRCELLEPLEQGKSDRIPDSYGAIKPRKGLIGVGDHVLVLARVVEILDRDKADDGEETKYGLSYVDGSYRQAGDTISPKDERPAEDQVEEGKQSS